jgi:hypothetical protein
MNLEHAIFGNDVELGHTQAQSIPVDVHWDVIDDALDQHPASTADASGRDSFDINGASCRLTPAGVGDWYLIETTTHTSSPQEYRGFYLVPGSEIAMETQHGRLPHMSIAASSLASLDLDDAKVERALHLFVLANLIQVIEDVDVDTAVAAARERELVDASA